MKNERTTQGAAAVAQSHAGLGGGVIGGRYQLHELERSDGISAVYRGHALGHEQAVTIEVIRPRVRDRALYVERLVRESRTIAQVRHPNVVDILDVGVTEDDAVYVVTERLEGRSLAALLRETSPLPWPRVCAIAVQVVSGLGAVHAHGVIHRDINPSRVMLLESDAGVEAVKLVDFGLAETKADGRAPTLANASAAMGTAAYFAPEVARGRKADVRSEVYAVGVLLYEMATGATPFSGDGPLDVLAKVISNPLPAPRTRNPALPEEVDRLIRRCLAKRPDLRPATMDVLEQQLRALAAGPEPVASAVSGAIETTQVTAAPTSASPTAQRGVPVRAARERAHGEDPADVLEAAMSEVLELSLEEEEGIELESSLVKARRQARSKPPLRLVPDPEPSASEAPPARPTPQGQTAVSPMPGKPPTLDERFVADLPEDAPGPSAPLGAAAALPVAEPVSDPVAHRRGRFVLWMMSVPLASGLALGGLWLAGVFSPPATAPAPTSSSAPSEPTDLPPPAGAKAGVTWDEDFRATPEPPEPPEPHEPRVYAPDTYTPPSIRRPDPADLPAPDADGPVAASEPEPSAARSKRRHKKRRPRSSRPAPAAQPTSRPPPPPPPTTPAKKARPSKDAEPWKRVPVPSDNW